MRKFTEKIVFRSERKNKSEIIKKFQFTGNYEIRFDFGIKGKKILIFH